MSALLLSAACAGISLVTVAALIPVLRIIAMDSPNERSSHVTPTPRSGGIGVLVAVGVGIGLWSGDGNSVEWGAVAGAVAFALLGFVDDVRSLSAILRLGVQLLISLIVTVWALHGLEPWLLLASPVLIAGIVNVVNFMDGINGITAMMAALCGLWYAVLANNGGVDFVWVLGLTMAGASVGFGLLNVMGRVFLGDVGSYFLGGCIAYCGLALIQQGTSLVLVIAPILLYGVDTVGTLVWRTYKGHSVGAPHRGHVYQRLSRTKLGHIGSSGFVTALSAGGCVLALLVNTPLATLGLLAICGVYLASPSVAFRLGGGRV